jgi:hypothetical protein
VGGKRRAGCGICWAAGEGKRVGWACFGSVKRKGKEGSWTWAEREEVRVGIKEKGERERMGKV